MRITVHNADNGRDIVVEVPLSPGQQALVTDPEQPQWVRDELLEVVQGAVRQCLEQQGAELVDASIDIVTE